jgi:hypothetical protein
MFGSRVNHLESKVENLSERIYRLERDSAIYTCGEGQNAVYFMFQNRSKPIGAVVRAILKHFKLEPVIEEERLVLREKR